MVAQQRDDPAESHASVRDAPVGRPSHRFGPEIRQRDLRMYRLEDRRGDEHGEMLCSNTRFGVECSWLVSSFVTVPCFVLLGCSCEHVHTKLGLLSFFRQSRVSVIAAFDSRGQTGDRRRTPDRQRRCGTHVENRRTRRYLRSNSISSDVSQSDVDDRQCSVQPFGHAWSHRQPANGSNLQVPASRLRCARQTNHDQFDQAIGAEILHASSCATNHRRLDHQRWANQSEMEGERFSNGEHRWVHHLLPSGQSGEELHEDHHPESTLPAHRHLHHLVDCIRQ